MTPVLMTEGGRAAPALGRMMAGDRGGIAVLDEEGVVLFTGGHADAQAFMCRHGYKEHANCELIENRGYVVGFEAF